jgi:CelD/BcsL family acetyltransferase involved in cellulose biosynthesis
MSGISTRVVRTLEELEALAPAWWELWRRCASATAFQSPAWLVPWWRTFAPGQLFVLVAERPGRLIGLAPFYLERGAMACRLLPIGISLSDYHDVLLDPDGGPEIGAALVAEALRTDREWDRWDLEELPPGAAAASLAFPPSCQVETSVQSACPVLALDAGALTACLPKKKRRALNLAHSRAARRGGAAIEEVGENGLDEALGHLFRLHASRWAQRGEAGVLATDEVQRFHREAAPALARAGLLRLRILRIGNRLAAAYYGLHDRDRAYAYVTGLDPEFAFESPGVIILSHAIETALQEGARSFHFLRGQEPYKYRWGAVDCWNERRSVRRSGFRDVAA